MTGDFPTRGVFVAGRFEPSGDRLAVTNPYTQEPLPPAPVANAQILERAIAAGFAATRAARALPRHERADVLQSVADAIRSRRDAFIRTIIAEAGKPKTLAAAEVDRAVVAFAESASAARRESGRMLSIDAYPPGMGHYGFVRRFPVGLIYGITPFNFPLNLVAHKIAPAVASGNCILIKPSPRTPFTALLLAEVLAESRLMPGQVSILPLANDLAGAAAGDDRVAMVSFTGSGDIGWKVKETAYRKKVTLELGGNAAVVVHDDADLAAAIPAIAAGAFAYAGQSCISVQRVFIQRRIYREFVQRLLGHIRDHVIVGDPSRDDVLVGPMIDPAAAARVGDWVDRSVAGGAKVLCGNELAGSCLLPTVVEDPHPDSWLNAREVFGPVMTVNSYDDFDSALESVNASRYGLQAGVFTADLSRAMRAVERLDVGGVLVNQAPTFRVENMPYGGVKESGFGREGVEYAMSEMTEPRTIIIKSGSGPIARPSPE